ncbi:putative NRPS-like protein biosynthetic cluster [Pyricularia oryzae]|nr:putative NRPS-like protein biosynthetic cluster [Pyricularia oryzae]
MVFYPPSWVPKPGNCNTAQEAPDSVSIEEFMSDEKYGRQPFAKSRNPFTCGITGRSYSHPELFARADFLARALSRRSGWAPDDGLTPWDKVVAIFSINTIDYLLPAYAAHRMNGIATPVNAAYTASELEHQLRSAGAGMVFTCTALLGVTLKAADAAGIRRERIFLLPTAGDAADGAATKKSPFPNVQELIAEGQGLDSLQKLKWIKGQGARQVAFITYSSGTSGLPKAVMISHYNVICNVIAHTTFDSVSRKKNGIETEVELGLVPMSHTYGLLVVSHMATWRGDEIIVLPKFEMRSYLNAIQRFRIERLLVVLPIIIAMLNSGELCSQYDLSSVRFVAFGAAPLGEETIADLAAKYPQWGLVQSYGMTETAVITSHTSEHDILPGSSGSLLPGFRAKIVDTATGKEITSHNQAGELWIQASILHLELSPSVVLGYMNDERATTETFVYDADGRWVSSDDKVYVTTSPHHHEHLVVVDRIKELIKVNGYQVAPAELEAHILKHPAVFDVAVTQIPDHRAGEVPKAFVVRAPEYHPELPLDETAGRIIQHVADHKARYKWLGGGVEFVDAIPKTPSGKILRRKLREPRAPASCLELGEEADERLPDFEEDSIDSSPVSEGSPGDAAPKTPLEPHPSMDDDVFCIKNQIDQAVEWKSAV